MYLTALTRLLASIDVLGESSSFLSDAGVLVDGEQRNWQWQRQRGDRRVAAGSRIGDPLRRLSTVAAVLRRHLLYSLHADRHPGKSHHGDSVVSHQKGP